MKKTLSSLMVLCVLTAMTLACSLTRTIQNNFPQAEKTVQQAVQEGQKLVQTPVLTQIVSLSETLTPELPQIPTVEMPNIELPTELAGVLNSKAPAEFPVTPDAANLVALENGNLSTANYQTSLTLPEIMTYCRDFMTKKGLTERKALTSTSENTFSMVFDGSTTGFQIVIQAVLLDKMTNVNVRYEKVD
jgi:hypothetical protein